MMNDELFISQFRPGRTSQAHAFDHSMEWVQIVASQMHHPHSDVHAIYIPAVKSAWKRNQAAKFQEPGLEVQRAGRRPVQVEI